MSQQFPVNKSHQKTHDNHSKEDQFFDRLRSFVHFGEIQDEIQTQAQMFTKRNNRNLHIATANSASEMQNQQHAPIKYEGASPTTKKPQFKEPDYQYSIKKPQYMYYSGDKKKDQMSLSQQYRDLKKALHIDQNQTQQNEIQAIKKNEQVNFNYPKPHPAELNINQQQNYRKKSPIDNLSVFNTLNFVEQHQDQSQINVNKAFQQGYAQAYQIQKQNNVNYRLPQILTNSNDLLSRFKHRENQAYRQIQSTKNEQNENNAFNLQNLYPPQLIQSNSQQYYNQNHQDKDDENNFILVDPDLIHNKQRRQISVSPTRQEQMFDSLQAKLINFQKKEVTTSTSKIRFVPDGLDSKQLTYPSQTYVKDYKPDFKMDPQTVVDQIRKRQFRDVLIKMQMQKEQVKETQAKQAQQLLNGVHNNIQTQSQQFNTIGGNQMQGKEQNLEKLFPLKKFLKDSSIKEQDSENKENYNELNTTQQKVQNAQSELRQALQLARQQKKEKEEQQKKLEQEEVIQKEKIEMGQKLGKFTALTSDGQLPQNTLSSQEQLKQALLEARRRKREDEEQKKLLIDSNVKVQIEKHKLDIKESKSKDVSPKNKPEAQLALRIKAPTISINQGKTEQQLAEEKKVQDASKKLREALQEAKRIKLLKEQEEANREDIEFKKLSEDMNAEKAKIFIEQFFKKQFAPKSHLNENSKELLSAESPSQKQSSSLFQKLLKSNNLSPMRANKMLTVIKEALKLKLYELQDTLKKQKTEKEQNLEDHERKYKESLNQQVIELENLINQLDNPMLNYSGNNEKGNFLNLDNISFKGQEFDAIGQANSRTNGNNNIGTNEDYDQSGNDITLNLSMKTMSKDSVIGPKFQSKLHSNQGELKSNNSVRNGDNQAQRIHLNFNGNQNNELIQKDKKQTNQSSFKQITYNQQHQSNPVNWNTESKHMDKRKKYLKDNNQSKADDIEQAPLHIPYTQGKERNRDKNYRRGQDDRERSRKNTASDLDLIKKQKITEIREYITQSLKPQIKISSKETLNRLNFDNSENIQSSSDKLQLKLQMAQVSDRSTADQNQQNSDNQNQPNAIQNQKTVFRVKQTGPSTRFKQQLKQLLNIDQHPIRTYEDEIKDELQKQKKRKRVEEQLHQYDENKRMQQIYKGAPSKQVFSDSKLSSFQNLQQSQTSLASSPQTSPFKMSYMNTGVLGKEDEKTKSIRRSKKAIYIQNPDYMNFSSELNKLRQEDEQDEINQRQNKYNQMMVGIGYGSNSNQNSYQKIKTSKIHKMSNHQSSQSINQQYNGQSSTGSNMTLPYYSMNKLNKYVSDKNLVYQ
eukprot:403372447